MKSKHNNLWAFTYFHNRRLSENRVRSEIERKFRRQGGKAKITEGVVNAMDGGRRDILDYVE